MELLKKLAGDFNIYLSDEKLEQFQIYSDYLSEYNLHTNLTAITDFKDIVIKHFLDSIIISKFLDIDKNLKLIDIGTGAGFPGLPVKICNPNFNVSLMDSSSKRTKFLQKLTLKLNVKTDIINGRAEILGLKAQYREKFDVAVSRAVAPLNMLVEYCLSYVKTGGLFLALKGPNILEELENSKNSINLLGGKLKGIQSFELPLGKGSRNVVVLEKIKHTPKTYPRRNSQISLNPL